MNKNYFWNRETSYIIAPCLFCVAIFITTLPIFEIRHVLGGGRENRWEDLFHRTSTQRAGPLGFGVLPPFEEANQAEVAVSARLDSCNLPVFLTDDASVIHLRRGFLIPFHLFFYSKKLLKLWLSPFRLDEATEKNSATLIIARFGVPASNDHDFLAGIAPFSLLDIPMKSQ